VASNITSNAISNFVLDCGKDVGNKTVDGTPWLVYIHMMEPKRVILGIGSIISPNVVVASNVLAQCI